MEISCSAQGCTNKHSNGTTLRFHRFPLKRPDMLKKWVNAVCRKGFKPSMNSFICSEHFLISNYLVAQLNKDAVPSNKKHLQKPTINKSSILRRTLLIEEDEVNLHEPTINKCNVLRRTLLIEGNEDNTEEITNTDEVLSCDEAVKEFGLVKTSNTTKAFSSVGKSNSVEASSNTEASRVIQKYDISSEHNYHMRLGGAVAKFVMKPIETLTRSKVDEGISETSSTNEVSSSCEASGSVVKYHFGTQTDQVGLSSTTILEYRKYIKNLNQQIRRHDARIKVLKEFIAKNCRKKPADKNFQRCKICRRKLPKEELAEHVSTHEKTEMCEQCGNKFYTVHHLRMHMKMHALPDEIMCHVCGEVCARRQYKVHLLKHKDRPKCELCGRRFRSLKILRSHMVNHERGGDANKPYNCSVCKEGFNSINTLTNHNKQFHFKEPVIQVSNYFGEDYFKQK